MSNNGMGADIGQKRVSAKRFPLVDIRNMHFYNRRADSRHRIAQTDTGVSISTGIEHDSLCLPEPVLLDGINEVALVIALNVGQAVSREEPLEFFQIILKTAVPVQVGFALPEQVEVRSVQNQDVHRLLPVNRGEELVVVGSDFDTFLEELHRLD